MTGKEKLVHNERTKLLAGFCNNIASASFALGGIASVVRSLSSEVTYTTKEEVWILFF